MVDYSNLPIEIINIIINYTNIVVYRNGKYINRINKLDSRYNIIEKRKKPIWFGNNRFMFYFRLSMTRGFAIEHYIVPNPKLHFLHKRDMVKNDNGSIQYENEKHYVFDLQGECRQIVHYNM